MFKFVFLSLFVLFTPPHKFYVSLSEVRYNTEIHSVEISTKLFINDLETAISGLDIEKEEDEAVNELLSIYLQDKMNISVNDEPITLSYIGYEIDDDVVWCYLEGAEVSYPKTVEISFKMLLDEFSEQTNIVHFDLEKDIKSVFLRRSEDSGVLVF